MTLVQTNRSAFTSAEAITSATQTTITRTSAANGLPGDSNGPPSGDYAVVFTDGTNFEIAYVTGGQGTTTLTLQRAAELIGGTQTALSSVASGTQFYAVRTAALDAIPSFDETVLSRLSLAPVAYWKLNEPAGSTTAADSSGNGYTLTVNGTVTFGEPSVVPTDSETSAQSDGSTGYLSGGPFTLIPTGASPFTLIAAVKWGGSSAEQFVAAWGGSSGPALLWASALLYFDNNTAGSGEPSAGVPVAGLPHLLGMVWDGAVISGYLDGAWAVGNTNGVNAASAAFYLMGFRGATDLSNFPVGRVAIFAGVLTPKDWALLMQAFTGVS